MKVLLAILALICSAPFASVSAKEVVPPSLNPDKDRVTCSAIHVEPPRTDGQVTCECTEGDKTTYAPLPIGQGDKDGSKTCAEFAVWLNLIKPR